MNSLEMPCKITTIKENYNHQNTLVKSTVINSLYRAKCVIKLDKFITFEKIDSNKSKVFS